MEKIKNIIKKFNDHIVLLLILFISLHFFLKLINVRFRKWVYVTIISIFSVGIFIKIIRMLYSDAILGKKYIKQFFSKYLSIIVVVSILLGIIFWKYLLLIIFLIALTIDSITDNIIPNYERVIQIEDSKYVASINPLWMDAHVDYYEYINFFIMGNKPIDIQYHIGVYDLINRQQEELEEKKNYVETTNSDDNHKDTPGIEDTEKPKKFKKISKENLLYEKKVNNNIIIRVGTVGNSLGGKMGIEIQKTTNGGKTWKNQIKNKDEYILINNEAQIIFINENVGFINNNSLFILGQENDSLLVTVDGGESFKASNFVFSEDIKDTSFYIQDLPILSNKKLQIELFAPRKIGSKDGNYYKFISVDNGQNWTIAEN